MLYRTPITATLLISTLLFTAFSWGCAEPFDPYNKNGDTNPDDTDPDDTNPDDVDPDDTNPDDTDPDDTNPDDTDPDDTNPDDGINPDPNPFPGCADLFPENDDPSTAHDVFGGPVQLSNTSTSNGLNVRFRGNKPEYFKVTTDGAGGSNRPTVYMVAYNTPEDVRMELTAACSNGQDRTVNCTNYSQSTRVGDTQCDQSGSGAEVRVSTTHGCRGGDNDYTATLKVWFPNSIACHNISLYASVTK